MILWKVLIWCCFIYNACASALYDTCNINENCGTLDTYCKNNTCSCIDNFVALYDSCIQVAPNINCTKRINCQNLIGNRSLCKKGRCVCNSFHHLHNGQCIKSKGLDEFCSFDSQCYCGLNCKDKIQCHNGICKCKLGYYQHNRQCVAKATKNKSSSFLLGTTSFLNTFLNILILGHLLI